MAHDSGVTVVELGGFLAGKDEAYSPRERISLVMAVIFGNRILSVCA